MTEEVLSPDRLAEEMKMLDVEWSDLPNGLVRVFEMPDFKTGFALVAKIAELAEEQNHHPDVVLGYDKVEITLITHSAGGITAKDVQMAQQIDKLV